MSQSSLSSAGSTQNQFAAVGSATLAYPSPEAIPKITIAYTSNAYSVSSHDSGATFNIPSSTSDSTITLPAPATGCPIGTTYNFQFAGNGSGAVTFTTATNSIYGLVKAPASNGTTYTAYAGATTAVASKTGTYLGDSVSFVSDGGKWYILGQTQGTGPWA